MNESLSKPGRTPGPPPGIRQDALDAIVRAVTQRAYWHAGALIEQFVTGATLEELLALRQALEELAGRRRNPDCRPGHERAR